MLPVYRPSGNSTWDVDTGNHPYIKFLDPEPIAASVHGFRLVAGGRTTEHLLYGSLRESLAPTADLFLVAGRLTPPAAGFINAVYSDPSKAKINYGTSIILIGGTGVGRTFITGPGEEHVAQSVAQILPDGAVGGYFFPSDCAGFANLDYVQVCQATALLWNYDAAATDIKLEIVQDDPFEGYEKYNQPNWDGFGAEPIATTTLEYARHLFQSLPDGLTDPHIAPGADGSIGFYWSWDDGPFRSLCLDIGPGDKWRAYWQRRDGRFGRLPSRSRDRETTTTLAKLLVS